MYFSTLSEYLLRLEETPSRNEITKILSDLFKETTKDEIDEVVYLVLGQLAPNYKGIVLNIADRMMIRIIAMAYEKKPEDVKKLYKKNGDLGEVAFLLDNIRNLDLKTNKLSVSEVFQSLLDIADDGGEGS